MTQPRLSTLSPHHFISGDTFLLCVRHRWQLKYLGHLSEHMWLCVCVCVCRYRSPCVITFSGNADDIDLAAHYSTGREELFPEDDGLDPNLEPVRDEAERFKCFDFHVEKLILQVVIRQTSFMCSVEAFLVLFYSSWHDDICDGGEGEGMLGVSNHVLSPS